MVCVWISRRWIARRRWWRLLLLLLEVVRDAADDFVIFDALPPELVKLVQAGLADRAQGRGDAVERGDLQRSTFVDFLQQKLITLVVAKWLRYPVGR